LPESNVVNIGTYPNDGTGDPVRTAFANINVNFANIYTTYQTSAGMSSNVATLTANNVSFVGSVSAANVVSNAQLTANLANYVTTTVLATANYQTAAGLSANVAKLTSNNADNLGGVAAASYALSSTLPNYQTTAGLSANVATLAANTANNAYYLNDVIAASYQLNSTLSANVATMTANNTSFVGSVTAANVVSNAQLSANLSNYQTTAGLSANVSTLTSNNTSFVGSVTAANVVSNAQLSANLSNFLTISGVSSNVARVTANNATYAFGKTENNLNVNNAFYTNSAFSNQFTVGTSVYFVSNGNVGFGGNDAPSSTLTINGTIEFANGTIKFSDGSVQNTRPVANGTASKVAYYAANGAYVQEAPVYISTSNGNVGLGGMSGDIISKQLVISNTVNYGAIQLGDDTNGLYIIKESNTASGANASLFHVARGPSSNISLLFSFNSNGSLGFNGKSNNYSSIYYGTSGQYLTSNGSAGAPYWSSFNFDVLGAPIQISNSTYTVQSSDNGKILEFTNTCTITLPSGLNAMKFDVIQTGTNPVLISGGTSRIGNVIFMTSQYAGCSVYNGRGANNNNWLVVGDISAS
jgi:hypothetical protein